MEDDRENQLQLKKLSTEVINSTEPELARPGEL